ncbi:carbohydrate esterase family 4 protein [Mycena latifolia]|nr:carbohydrate esterase family 4 protein [Mycena latifolia]
MQINTIPIADYSLISLSLLSSAMLVQAFVIFLTPVVSWALSIEEASASKAMVYTACKVPNTVALTFDDGPYKYMAEISDLLTNKSAKGTFFVNGYNYDCIYSKKVAERLQYVYSRGNQICSHTWSHADLTDLNSTQIADELTKIDVALMNILGITSPFLRPPYGSYDDLVRRVAFQQNKSLILWDFDSQDSLNATVQQSQGYYDDVINSTVSTLLALNHETEKTTAQVLVEYAIDKLQDANHTLVTVAECLGLDPYSFVGPLGQRDDSWFCPENVQ